MRIMALVGIITTTLGVMLMSWVQSTASSMLPCVIPVMDSLTVQADFDLERWLGDWYRINGLAERRDEVTGEVSISSDSKFIFWLEKNEETGKPWLNMSLQARAPNATECHVRGQSTHLITTPEPAKLKLYRSGPNRVIIKDFWILHTDYDDYTLVYACHEKDLEGRCETRATYMYVLGRRTSLAPEHRRVVDAEISTLCLNMTNYVTTPFDNPCEVGTGARHVMSLLLVLVLALLSIAA